MDINQIALYTVVILACNPTMAGYTDKGATELFMQCLHAKTKVDRLKCETEYLHYREVLEDKRKVKEQHPKGAT
jgi:hypothetical protein